MSETAAWLRNHYNSSRKLKDFIRAYDSAAGLKVTVACEEGTPVMITLTASRDLELGVLTAIQNAHKETMALALSLGKSEVEDIQRALTELQRELP